MWVGGFTLTLALSLRERGLADWFRELVWGRPFDRLRVNGFD